MRKLRVVFTTIGGTVPAIVATMVGDACGGSVKDDGATADATVGDAPQSSSSSSGFASSGIVSSSSSSGGFDCRTTHLVDIPPPGVVADPGQICAVAKPPAASNTAARVTLSGYTEATRSAVGFVALGSGVAGAIQGLPEVVPVAGSDDVSTKMTVGGMTKVAGGYRFDATWPSSLRSDYTELTVKTTFTIGCDDGGTQTVESLTKLELCLVSDAGAHDFVSSGDACTVCRIIAEMAPTPIASDNAGDDLPLGRVIRLRVIEVARSGRQALLFAENDAGEGLELEWRVHGGTLERVADDVVLWTLPDEAGETPPFGQVAVWNEAGAVVENFVWGTA